MSHFTETRISQQVSKNSHHYHVPEGLGVFPVP